MEEIRPELGRGADRGRETAGGGCGNRIEGREVQNSQPKAAMWKNPSPDWG